MSYQDILQRLKSLADPDALAGMARYGIGTQKALGGSIPNLRALARENRRDHDLAQAL